MLSGWKLCLHILATCDVHDDCGQDIPRSQQQQPETLEIGW